VPLDHTSVGHISPHFLTPSSKMRHHRFFLVQAALVLIAFETRTASAFFFSFVDGIQRTSLKAQLLQLCRDTQRGITATPEQEQRIKSLFERLERVNPTPNPLRSPSSSSLASQSSMLINGKWSLEYSTAGYIIGKGDVFPRVGPIVQRIDTTTSTAENSEVVSYFGIPIARKVTAELIPPPPSSEEEDVKKKKNQLTYVQFKRFSVGPVAFDAPKQFQGFLDITYLDKDLRLTRGDKGNLFVLTRME
jgi:hypothetical protein